jgi:acetoin utilization protein AcuB
MYVKDHMTKDLKTIDADTSVLKALEIMGKNNFHRLPVTDENGQLIGLITEGLVNESSGKNATSLSIYELNYLLSRTKAGDIMITDVKTITPDAFLEEAASVMLDNAINVLPVVTEGNKVVGIITEKDMFQAFTELMGYKHQGTKFVINCDDVPGIFAKIANLFAENDANLESAAVYHNSERGTEIVVKATGIIPVESMTDILKEAGFNVTRVIQTTNEGKTVVFM